MKDSKLTKIKKKRKLATMDSAHARITTKVAGIIGILVLLVLIVSTIAAQFRPGDPVLNAPRNFINAIVSPLQRTFSGATDYVMRRLRALKYREQLEREYENLLSQVDELTDRAMRVEALEYELSQYADLSEEIKRNSKLNGIKANVIGQDTSNYTFSLTLDVGSNHGVKDFMAVVVPGGLIGYTYDVRPTTCSVKAIIDANASIAALIESSRDQGTLQGSLAINGKKECRMYYLSYTTLPRPGDRVVTSGVGMEFPKGIPIGYVRESTRGKEDSKQFIVVDPIANFDHLEYVIVYRYSPKAPEVAQMRGTLSEATFVPMPTPLPEATFLGQKTMLTPTPEPEATATPAPTVSPAPTPASGAEGENVVYIDRVTATHTPAPTEATEEPATPAPTFSVEQMTVEDD